MREGRILAFSNSWWFSRYSVSPESIATALSLSAWWLNSSRSLRSSSSVSVHGCRSFKWF